jgi:hypothetical protein
MDTTIETLRSLEAKYLKRVEAAQEALEKVRDLIREESGQTSQVLIVPVRVRRRANIDAVKQETSFSGLTKGDAAAKIMAEAGRDMTKKEIFDEMKSRGHGVASLIALTSTLSEDDRFLSLGKGVWALAQREVTNGTQMHK